MKMFEEIIYRTSNGLKYEMSFGFDQLSIDTEGFKKSFKFLSATEFHNQFNILTSKITNCIIH